MHDDAMSGQTRVEMLRQKLEQYNAGIARAMSDLAVHAAAAGGASGPHSSRQGVGPTSAPLVPPSLSGVRPLSSSTSRPVERDLGSEFLSMRSSASKSQGRSSGPIDVAVDADALSDGAESAQVASGATSSAGGDVTTHNVRISAERVGYDVDDGFEEFHEVTAAASRSTVASSTTSPQPQAPTYTFEDLETSYHRVNAIQECARIVSSFPGVAFSAMHEDRANLLLEAREQMLARDRALRDERRALFEQRSHIEQSESDLQSTLQDLLTETEEARKCFSPIYERKAVLYAKEKQLEQLGTEMQRLHQVTQNRRSTLASIENRVEQRARALRRREDAFKQALAGHASREEDLRKKVEKVEELNGKIVSWIKILETRESELTSKEQRLKTVQLQLNRRVSDLNQKQQQH